MASPHYPEGSYGIRITSQKLCRNERTDNYQVVIEFEPMRLENASAPEDAPERWRALPVEAFVRSLYLPLTEKAAPITADKLERLGIVFDDWSRIDETHPRCVSIIGEKRRLTCRHETWEGQVRERWDVPFAGGAGKVESLDPGEAAQVQAMFGHLAKGAETAPVPEEPEETVGAAPAGSAQPSTAAQSENEGADDLPF